MNEISQYASFSTGIFLTGIRLSEPYFYYVTRRRWLEFFGIAADKEIENTNNNNDGKDANVKKRKTNELYNNTLNYFLTKSLSTELVTIMLNGITDFTKKSFDDHYSNNEVGENENEYTMLRKLEFSRIEIENTDP